VLWTGNPVIAKEPAVPWLLDGHLVETRTTLQAVYGAFDAETKIVPGHVPLTNLTEISWNVEYLTEVEIEVKQAFNDGLNLEETMARVDLAGFGGYAMFGWAHPTPNVPAAYKDMK
jgi:hypothetical protein